MSEKILVIGATSAIAEAACHIWRVRGAHLALAGRNAQRLDALRARLESHGSGEIHIETMDAADTESMASLVPHAARVLNGLDMVLIAHGSLTDRERAQADPAYLAAEISVNLTSIAIAAESAIGYFEGTGKGTLAIIGSIAGDRGKRRNYNYGMAKSALHTLAQGLYHRCVPKGIRVVMIKPGPVDTPMTATHRKTKLFARPEEVGADIVRAMDAGTPTIYSPPRWRWMMAIVRMIPDPIFVRLDL